MSWWWPWAWLETGRRAGEPVWLLPRERSAMEDWRLMFARGLLGLSAKGELERCGAVEGVAEGCGRDKSRSEVGVPSSTMAEVDAEDAGCWFWRA